MRDPIERNELARSGNQERDALTGTLPRPTFIDRLRARVDSAVVHGSVFGLCLLDLDHFKNINLSHGPTCGDGALRDIAARLVRTTTATLSVAEAPAVGRIDGDTFAVIAETESRATLGNLAEALRQAVSASPGPTGVRLSASVGAALARRGETADAVLVRAEQALYLAKQWGRDRIEVAISPEPKRGPTAVLPLRRRA